MLLMRLQFSNSLHCDKYAGLLQSRRNSDPIYSSKRYAFLREELPEENTELALEEPDTIGYVEFAL